MTPLARIAVAFAAVGLFIGTVALSVHGTPTSPPTTVPNLPPLTISIAPTPPGAIGTPAVAVPLAAPTTTASPPVPDGRALAVVPSWARCPQWWRAAQRAGWTAADMATLDLIMWGESRCQPTVVSSTNDHGLTQINARHLSTPGYAQLCARSRGRICSTADLAKPQRNLRAARILADVAESWFSCEWQPWRVAGRSLPC